jgi:Ca2+-binding RTX toxin-like protein
MSGPGGIINLTNGDDIFPGVGDDNSGDETVYGLDGNDQIDSGPGNDALYGGNGDDLLIGSGGNDALYGGGGNDAITDFQGTTVNIEGGDGDDTVLLSFGLVSGTLSGGAGADTLNVYSSFDLSGIALSGFEFFYTGQDIPGARTIIGTLAQFDSFETIASNPANGIGVTLIIAATGAAQSVDLSDEIGDRFLILHGSDDDETITGGGGGALLDGNGGSDTLTGGLGRDVLSGGAGTNILNGGGGIDTASYEGASGGVTVSLAVTGAQNTVGAGVDTLMQIENLRGSDFDDTLTGDGGGNELEGWFGNDALYGGGGNDTITDVRGPSTIIDGGEGNDIVQISQNFFSSGSLKGGLGADTLRLSGGGSLEQLSITGFEILEVDENNTTATAALFESFDTMLGGVGSRNVVKLTIIASGSAQIIDLSDELNSGSFPRSLDLTASSDSEIIIGGNTHDVLRGNGGDDIVDGGGAAGQDSMDGGSGVDTLSYISAGGAVTISLAITAAQDTKGAGIDTVSQFENLTGSNFADTLTGDSLDNILTGGFGDDTLNGGLGSDTADYSGAAGNLFIGLGFTGFQSVGGGLGSDLLAGVENLRGGAFEDQLKGNAGDNRLEGQDGADRLYGGDGLDTLYGGAGRDYAVGGAGNDVLYGGDETGAGDTWLSGAAGDDIVYGGGGSDRLDGDDGVDALYGGLGDDYITGGSGADVIDSGAGTDSLFGGADADIFDFNPGMGTDNIYDFTNGEDILQIDPLFGMTVAQVVAAASVYGNHAYINLGGGDGLILLNWISSANTIAQLADHILIV